MSKHIKKFETEQAFAQWRQSQDCELPQLSWCETENTIKSEALIAPPETGVALQSITITGPDAWDYYDGHQNEETWTFEYTPSDTTQTGVSAAMEYVSGDDNDFLLSTQITGNTCKVHSGTQYHGFSSYYDLVLTSVANPNISTRKRIHFYSSR